MSAPERMSRAAGRAERRTLADRAQSQRKHERNDALFEDGSFRDFLADVADRAGYLAAESPLDDWMRGYRAALRDLVNGLVVNSSRGAGWLSAYAATHLAEQAKTEIQAQ